MKKTAKILVTLMFTMAAVACGSADSTDSDITLRVIPPIATESGTTAQVEVQSPVSGEFERIQEISLVDIGDILVNEEAIKGVLVELGGTTGTPIFSTVVYFDGAVAAAPVELVTKVPAGTEVTVRTQLVVETEEKVFPEVYEKVLMAEQINVQMMPVETVR